MTAGFAVIVAGGEFRQGPPGGRRPPSFTEMDKNKDSKVSREEWQGPTELFDRIDANKDGSLSQDEMSALPQFGPGGPLFAGQLLRFLDADADGKITQAEFGKITSLFDSLDQNKDGSRSKVTGKIHHINCGTQTAARHASSF